jgi:hypothetical protein
MRFFTVTLAAVFASVVFAASSTENAIIKPDGKDSIVAGEPYVIKWKPTTKGGITLTLRQGTSTDLKDVDVIVCKFSISLVLYLWKSTNSHIIADTENTGEYEWTPDAQLPAGDNYAIMITSKAGEQNYTPLLKIESNAKPSSSSSSASESKSKSHKPTKTSDHSAHITPISNSTISKPYSNSTISTKKPKKSTTTLEASSTAESSSSPEPTAASASATPSAPASGAMAVARSPIAFVACLIAGFVFLN